MIGLLSFSVLLFVISVFLKDPYKELSNELEQLSMQQIQEHYQINRKLKILEEELLLEDHDFYPGVSVEPSFSEKKEVHAIIKNQVWSLAQQGLSVEQISIQSSLPTKSVQNIIKEFQGERYV
jgi:hypothetical protein